MTVNITNYKDDALMVHFRFQTRPSHEDEFYDAVEPNFENMDDETKIVKNETETNLPIRIEHRLSVEVCFYRFLR